VKYTIVHVNNRAKEQMDSNKEILKSFDYVDDIEFFDGNKSKAWDVINHRGIRTDVWSPYDGRQSPAFPGEYGIWVSLLNIFEYIVKNNVNALLVIEDDVLLKDNAPIFIENCLSELPEGWDFLSLYYFEGHNQYSESSNIGKSFIHKSINQPAATQGMIYSKAGASKILKLTKRKGIEYTVDCFIYKQAVLGFLNGYSILPTVEPIIKHEYKSIKSLIDPNNYRKVEM
jgi:GR25 family glycosyltransferase involved in LPS biosynthesis